MYVTLKAGKSRTFNGLKISNAEDRPVKLRLEPGVRVTEEQATQGIHTEACNCQPPLDED